MQTSKKLIFALSTASLLVLSGCSSDSASTDSADSADGSTSADTISTVASHTTETVVASEDVPTETVTEEAAEPSNSEAAQSPAEGSNDPIPVENLTLSGIGVGSEINVGDEPATVCIYGDGWGTNVWAGGESTSCEFVSATYEELTKDLNATTETIRDNLPETVTVNSPVTGEEYQLACAQRGERLITCRGGDNAAVHLY